MPDDPRDATCAFCFVPLPEHPEPLCSPGVVREQQAELKRLRHALDGAGQHIGQVLQRAEQAEAAIARVREIHTPEQYHDEQPWCTYCNRDDNERDDVVLWPCPTIAALDASSAPESPTDAPTAPTRPDNTHQPHNDPETTP